jgi:hypothetical protein
MVGPISRHLSLRHNDAVEIREFVNRAALTQARRKRSPVVGQNCTGSVITTRPGLSDRIN